MIRIFNDFPMGHGAVLLGRLTPGVTEACTESFFMPPTLNHLFLQGRFESFGRLCTCAATTHVLKDATKSFSSLMPH